jgi:hypothetical protein
MMYNELAKMSRLTGCWLCWGDAAGASIFWLRGVILPSSPPPSALWIFLAQHRCSLLYQAGDRDQGRQVLRVGAAPLAHPFATDPVDEAYQRGSSRRGAPPPPEETGGGL